MNINKTLLQELRSNLLSSLPDNISLLNWSDKSYVKSILDRIDGDRYISEDEYENIKILINYYNKQFHDKETNLDKSLTKGLMAGEVPDTDF